MSQLLSRDKSSSYPLDDLIGTDSGAFLVGGDHAGTTESQLNQTRPSPSNVDRFKRSRAQSSCKTSKKKEYPPPISLLSHMGDCNGRLSYKLVKSYTDDGRLVIKAEEVMKPRLRFEKRKENGRFIMNLVPVDEPVESPDDAETESESSGAVLEDHCTLESKKTIGCDSDERWSS